MITNKRLTDWLFYRSPFKDTLDKGEYTDPKYIELNFPHRKEFCDELKRCSLKEFVSTLIWIFKDSFPFEYRYIEIFQLEEESDGMLKQNTNNRELKDIFPLEFIEDSEVFGYLLSLKIKFKENQPLLLNWVEEVIAGANFRKEQNGNATIYSIENSPIETLEVYNNYIQININQEKIDE